MRSPSLLAILSLAATAGCTEQGSGIKVHNDPPTASITAPEDGSEALEGDTVTLTGSVYDSKGIAKLEWRVGGDVVCDLASAPPDADGDTTCSWTVDDSADITLWVEDTQGLDAEDTRSIVMVENGTPSIQIVSPDGAAALYADIPVELSALVGDDRDSADALEVLWQLDGAPLTVIGANVSSDGVASGSANLPDGTLVVSAQVTDSLGKQSTDSVTVVVFEENTLPDCSILATPERAAAGDTITLSGTASDTQTAAGLLVTSLSSSLDGSLTDALTVATGGSWTWPTDTLSAGSHVITLTVTDDYGDACIETTTVEVCGDVWYADADGDSHGDPATAQVACDPPANTVTNADDCDDGDPLTYPGAAFDESSTDCMTDADGDGYGDSGAIAPVTAGSDCDDAEAAIHPDADEVCDTIDNDCDALVDDADTDVDLSTGSTFYTDADTDGYGDASSPVLACVLPSGAVADATDCDDTEALRNPGETEICDGLDNNCDSTIDEGVTTTYYQDADTDGFGDASASTEDCAAPSGYVSSSTDCDDTDSATYPGIAATDSTTACMTDSDGDGYGDSAPASGVSAGTDCDDADSSVSPAATEACDSIDNDCDGDIDDADSSLDTSTADAWYADSDADTFGDASSTTLACVQPSGLVADNTDCDDSDADTFPGIAATESTTACMTDSDGDGYGDSAPASGVSAGSDCNDADSSVSPAATEACDSIDNDCDGDIDDADSGLDTSTADTWYADSDGDTYGDASSITLACVQPSGSVADSSDCDDTDSATYPGIAATDSTTACMTDSDGDGYGDSAPASGVSAGSDCDDADSGVSPAATEECDSIDNDCDGDIDDADSSLDTSTADTWYADSDADTFGDASSTSLACAQPSGSVADNTDCDDTDSATYPGIAATDSTTACMTDSDGDGYGDSAPTSGVSAGSDCDDTDSGVSPAATEACDSIDNDCDGDIDDADSSLDTSTADTWYADSDGDTFGNPSSTSLACVQPSGSVADNTDCDDSDSATYPGVASTESTTACMTDSDGDGYGDTAPASGVSAGSDCDDADSAVSPAASEECDSIDNDCDGDIDDADSSLDTATATHWYPDSDGDLYGDSSSSQLLCAQPSATVADNTDCDDTDSAIHPGATEVCDASNVDEDCNGTADDLDAGVDVSSQTAWYADGDVDGYGDASATATMLCEAPSGYLTDNADCDDASADINPDALEVCDGVDNNCNGDTDLGVCGTLTASDADAVFTGQNAGDRFGSMLAMNGDLNGDGYPELIVGATTFDNTGTDDGAVYIYYGPATAGGGTGTAEGTLVGTDGDNLGNFVDAGGDLNGDGYDDMVLCESKSDRGVNKGGAAWIVYGPVTGTFSSGVSSYADAVLLGSGDTDYACYSGRIVEDFTGDGLDELFVGIYYADNSSGGAAGEGLIVNGSSTALSGSYSIYSSGYQTRIEGTGSNEYVGNAMSEGGDVDGDGFGDLLMGGHGYDGKGGLGLEYGPVTGLGNVYITDLDVRFVGRGSGDNAGWRVSTAGDATGDGQTDILMSATTAYDATNTVRGGAVYLFADGSYSGDVSVSSYDAVFYGEAANDQLGHGLALADVDGDGVADAVMSAPHIDSYTGAAFVFYGPLSGSFDAATDADATITGETTGAAFGTFPAAGDVDLDGFDDFAISEPTYVGTNAGNVHLFFGGLD